MERSKLAPEPLDEDDFADVVRSLVDEAEDWTDTNLRSSAADAWRRFHAGKDSVEAEPLDGGSELVIGEVRDTAVGIMPDLMELFAGSDRVVEYYDEGTPAPPAMPGLPPPPPRVQPEVATKQANEVFWSCGGWRALHDMTLEAVVAQIGWAKVHRVSRVKMQRFGPLMLSPMQAEGLQGSPDVAIDAAEPTPDGKLSIKGRRYYTQSWKTIEAIPAERIICTACVDPQHAHLVGEKREVRLGDLVAMGLKPEELADLTTAEEGKGDAVRRERSQQERDTPESHGAWALQPTTLYELYPLIDEDGDGLPERWRVLMAGPKKTMLRRELVDDHPYVATAAWLVPHRLNGMGLGDLVGDLQEARTKLVRSMLDNADDVNDPTILASRTGVDHNALVARRREKVVTCQNPALVQWFQAQPMIGQLLPINEMLDQIKESRTGQSRVAQGLDPDALQNTTAAAAMGTIGAAQRKQEMVARSLAEVGMKAMFKKLLRLLIEEGPTERQAPDGSTQRLDPAGYDPTWGVRVVVGLGNMRRQELRGFYQTAFQAAQAIIARMGPNNPVCSLQHVATMLTDWAALYPGVRPDRIFGSPQQVAQFMQQQQQQPPPPDPKMEAVKAKAQADQQKIALQAQTQAQKIALDTAKARDESRLRHAELGAEVQLEAAKVKMKGDQGHEAQVRRPQ